MRDLGRKEYDGSGKKSRTTLNSVEFELVFDLVKFIVADSTVA